MSVKCNLFYNFGTDTVIGLHDDGTTKTLSPATSVATIKVKGIRSNWKQPMLLTWVPILFVKYTGDHS
jgi:hypothetical protein